MMVTERSLLEEWGARSTEGVVHPHEGATQIQKEALFAYMRWSAPAAGHERGFAHRFPASSLSRRAGPLHWEHLLGNVRKTLNACLAATSQTQWDRYFGFEHHNLAALLDDVRGLCQTIAETASERFAEPTHLVQQASATTADDAALQMFLRHAAEMPCVKQVWVGPGPEGARNIVTLVERASRQQRRAIYEAEQSALTQHDASLLDFRLIDLSEYPNDPPDALVPAEMNKLLG